MYTWMHSIALICKYKVMLEDIFFLGFYHTNNRLIAINGNIHILCNILKFVVRSAAETKLSALYAKEGKVI